LVRLQHTGVELMQPLAILMSDGVRRPTRRDRPGWVVQSAAAGDDRREPTANAGPDQVAIVNRSVLINGSAADPDGDAITYSWQFTAQPSGSNAQLAQPNSVATTLIPDLPGVYIATLTASDFLGEIPLGV
jgi:hypothetical protein